MESPAEELKTTRRTLLGQLSQGLTSDRFMAMYVSAVDRYFWRSLQESPAGCRLFRDRKVPALLATGGYGRSELCLHSDIDLLVLFPSRVPKAAEALAADLCYPVWDLGLDLGYAIRDPGACMRLCREDFQVLSSMMHARFLCGDSSLFLAFMDDLYRKIIRKKARAFGEWIQDLYRLRTETFGDASHLLEPNLKEGIGGLRDYHSILWLARAFHQSALPRDLEVSGLLSHHEYRDLRYHLQFIWLVRNHLHLLSDRKNDRLNLEYQEEISSRLGFEQDAAMLPVERFLGNLHSAMAFVKSLFRTFSVSQLPGRRRHKPSGRAHRGLHITQGELYFDSATLLPSDPSLLMTLFVDCARSGSALSMESQRLVREFLYLVDEGFRSSPEAFQRFLSIFEADHSGKALDAMFDTGFLEAYIPEFGPIRDRIQFDTYHVFPAARHCLETLRYLETLPARGEVLLLDLFNELPEREPLFLAALFHDIGKVDRDHARAGEIMVRDILQRMGCAEGSTDQVRFLVRHHLMLAETATRRDLQDEKVVVRCARTIADTDRLKMLYLLTWADSMATGPRAWNAWIANLVEELFFKLLHVLEQKELVGSDRSGTIERNMKEVRDLSTLTPETLEALFDIMPERYLMNTPPKSVVRHLDLVRELWKRIEADPRPCLQMEAAENPGTGSWRLTFVAKDRPGLFSEISGVLALRNINILSADIYTWRDGSAVDVFNVSPPLDPLHPHETWRKVKTDLELCLRGDSSLCYHLSRKRCAYPPTVVRPPWVRVDNTGSDFFTIVEIFAGDTIGLLYQVTRTLFDLQLDIRAARIATQGDQVADVFYVSDLGGQKLEDEGRLSRIKRELESRLITMDQALSSPARSTF